VYGAHSKQKSTLLRKVWAFMFSPAFEVDFKNMNDHGPLGLRWRVFPRMGLIPNKSPLCCASLGFYVFSGF
jgi:hypothetical protein